jgi:cell division protein FtsB
MDEQYYRKAKPKATFQTWLKKQVKRRSVFIPVIIIVPVVSFMVFSNKGLLKRLQLEADKKEMLVKIEQAKGEQKLLEAQVKALDKDPRAVEKVAREKYGMIKPGETVYKVKKEK